MQLYQRKSDTNTHTLAGLFAPFLLTSGIDTLGDSITSLQ